MLIAMPVTKLHSALRRNVGRAQKIRARDKCNFNNARAKILSRMTISETARFNMNHT